VRVTALHLPQKHIVANVKKPLILDSIIANRLSKIKKAQLQQMFEVSSCEMAICPG